MDTNENASGYPQDQHEITVLGVASIETKGELIGTEGFGVDAMGIGISEE